VVSSDPVTGATRGVGGLAVNVACNDVATRGVRPVAAVCTLLLPPGTTEGELESLAADLAAQADALGVSVVGGHTEVTDAVRRVVVSITAIGIAPRGAGVSSRGALAGDALVMTKSAGLEGTAILAREHEAALRTELGDAAVDAALRLEGELSVVPEGVLAGALDGVHAMHDITEGGVLGAAWEMAEAAGLGCEVRAGDVPVLPETRAVCARFGLDPLRLVSSGSMLIAASDPAPLLAALEGAGIPAARVGSVLPAEAGRRLIEGGRSAPLAPPGPDELYRARA